MLSLIDFLQSNPGYDFMLTLPIDDLLNLILVSPKIKLTSEYWTSKLHLDFPNANPNPELTAKQNYLWFCSPKYQELSEDLFQPQTPILLTYQEIENIYEQFYLIFPAPELDSDNLETSLIKYKNILTDLNNKWGFNRFDQVIHQVTEQMIFEWTELVTIALNIVRDFPKSSYQRRFLESEIENLTITQLRTALSKFGSYIPNYLAKRNILNLLGLIDPVPDQIM